MQKNSFSPHIILLATVGMPGSGKSETASYFKEEGFSLIRFGDVTDEGLKEKGLSLTPDNEKTYREELRKEFGMEAYAVKSEAKIKKLLETENAVILDGLYSWEEYKYLLSRFPNLKLLHIYAQPGVRYKRLAKRPVRPFTLDEARQRDISEIEHLNKGGPIAIADFLIENNRDISYLQHQIDDVITTLKEETR